MWIPLLTIPEIWNCPSWIIVWMKSRNIRWRSGKERDATYAKPIKIRVRLHNKETDEIKEQEIFMGDFPLMTNGGTFVINGAERVIVSQIVRSPGMYYGDTVDKTDIHSYTATVIPYRGAWLEYETDANDVFYVRH